MIRFENLTKSFRVRGEQRIVIDNLTLTLPTGRSLALLGRNGSGKSTLLQMIAGTMRADSGSIFSDGTISWPVGFGGSFHGELTGAQNVRFIARIYGVWMHIASLPEGAVVEVTLNANDHRQLAVGDQPIKASFATR